MLGGMKNAKPAAPTPRSLGRRLHHAVNACARLSGNPGYRSAARELVAALVAFEAASGRRVGEPHRSLWLRQGELVHSADVAVAR